jgi:hypothetical protein
MKTENVIFQDRQKIAEAENRFQDGKQPLQNIVDGFSQLGIGSLSGIEELTKLMDANPGARNFGEKLDAFIEQKISDQVNEKDVPSFGMFKMRKKAAVAMIETPDLSPFIDVMSENFDQAARALPLSGMKNGSVILAKAKHTAMIQRYTVEAETPQEKDVLKKLHSIIETIEELYTAGAIIDRNVQQLKQIRMLANTKDLQIDPAYFAEIKSRISNNQN